MYKILYDDSSLEDCFRIFYHLIVKQFAMEAMARLVQWVLYGQV